MLLKISLIIAILASVGTLAVSELVVKKKFEDAKKEKEDLQAKVEETQKAKDKLAKEKGNLITELASTKTERDRANDAAKAADENAKKAEEAKLAADKKAEEADAKTQATIKANEGYFNLKMTPEQIKAKVAELENKKAALETANMERQILGQAYAKLKGQWDARTDPFKPAPPIKGVKGKVLAVDPKWQFVVVDVGLNQGVVPNGECLVFRGTKVIARLKMAKVDSDQTVANVMKDGRIKVDSEILEGDVVVGQ